MKQTQKNKHFSSILSNLPWTNNHYKTEIKRQITIIAQKNRNIDKQKSSPTYQGQTIEEQLYDKQTNHHSSHTSSTTYKPRKNNITNNQYKKKHKKANTSHPSSREELSNLPRANNQYKTEIKNKQQL